MVQPIRIGIFSSLFFIFAARAETWTDLESLRVVKAHKELAEHIENTVPQLCFRINEEKSELHLFDKPCEDKPTTRALQVWKVSKAVPSALSDYIKEGKAKLLKAEIAKGVNADAVKIAEIEEDYKKIEAFEPNDSFGRLIYMDINGKPIVVGFLKTDIAKDETNMGYVVDEETGKKVQKPYIGELCSGPWISICAYKEQSKSFIFRFRHVLTNEEGYPVDQPPVEYKIIDIPHSILYARGNDDFQPLTYFWMKDKNKASTKKVPLMQDWAEALRDFDALDKRVAPKNDRKRDTIPLREANFLTAIHPVNVVVVAPNEGDQKTFIHFGATVFYARKIAEESCESDTNTFSFFDLENISNGKIIHPEKLTHMNLDKEKPMTGLGGYFESFLPDEMPENENFETEVTTETALGTFELPQKESKKWSYVILKKAYNDKEYSTRFENPVREFLFVNQKEDGKWMTDLRASNPNDPYANNILLHARGIYYSPGSIRFIWQSRTPNLLSRTQPILRAASIMLTSIPFAHSTKEERDLNDIVRKQFRTYMIESADLGTTHGVQGLKDRYYGTLRDLKGRQNEFLNQLTSENIPAYVSSIEVLRTAGGGEQEVLKISKTNELLITLLKNPAKRELDPLIKDALKRIYDATDTYGQIVTEMGTQRDVEKHLNSIIQYLSDVGEADGGITETFAERNSKIQNLRDMRKQLLKVHKDLPMKYQFKDWVGDHDVLTTAELPKELSEPIFQAPDRREYFTRAEFVKEVNENFKIMNDVSKSDAERKDAATNMYEFIHYQPKLNRILEDYSKFVQVPRG
jgi:hypothetical protein